MQVYDLAQTRAALFAGTAHYGWQHELDAEHNALPVDHEFTADPDEADEDDALSAHLALMASLDARRVAAPAVSEPAAVPAVSAPALGDYLPVDVVAAETAAEHADNAVRFDRLVDLALVEALLEKYGFTLPPHSNRSKRRQEVLTAVASIMASALMAADAGRRCSVSFHRAHYTKRAQYEGKAYTHANIAEGVRRLSDLGLLGLRVAGGGKNRVRGVQSTFWATDLLLGELAGIELTHNPELRAPLRLKDRNGNLLPFKHSAVTRALMRDLNALNTWMKGFTVTLPGVEPTPRGQWRFEKEMVHDDGTRETVGSVVAPTSYPQVYQVFSRGDFDLHGRFYGYWQNIPAGERGGLMLNGMRTVELDYSAMHPTILYAERGHDVVAEGFDPYKVPGFENLRAACKLALNVGINAASLEEAVGALMARRKAKDPKKRWRLSRKRTVALLETAIAHNARIADAICSDAGIRLMRVDSRVMREVLFDCMAAAIPALPVHDSVVVPFRHKAQVKAIMEAAYLRVVKVVTPCVVKGSDEKVPQMVAGGARSVPAPLTASPETVSARPPVSRTTVPGALTGRVSLIASLKTSRSCRPSSAPSETAFPARLSVISSLKVQNLPLEPVDASDVSARMVSSQRRPADIWEGIPNFVDGKEDVGPDPYADLYGDVSAPMVREVQPDPESEAYEAAKKERQREERRKSRARWKDVVDQTLGRGRYRRVVASRSAAILLPTDPWGTLASCSGSA